MGKRVQRRRGTTAQHTTFTGAAGETTVDTDKNTVVVHDGVTVGGHPLITAGQLSSSAGTTYVNHTGSGTGAVTRSV